MNALYGVVRQVVYAIFGSHPILTYHPHLITFSRVVPLRL
jgi:hypothetical protein